MDRRLVWCARLGVVLGLLGSLVACGGGGGRDDPTRRDPDNVSGSGTAQLTTGSGGNWVNQKLGTDTNNLYIGNTSTQQEVPDFALWLGREADSSISLKRTTALANRGFSSSALMSNLPSRSNSNASSAMVAGAWSIVAWSAFDSSPGTSWFETLYVRVQGPGFDSGVVALTHDFESFSSMRMVLDASGQARVYWNETHRSGVNVRLVNGTWVPQADLGNVMSAVQQAIVDPGGQGWLFLSFPQDGGSGHYVRAVTAADGLGPEIRLDDPAQGDLVSRRISGAEGTGGFTTVSIQSLSGATSSCLAVRRMVANVLQAPQCIMVSGDEVPNQEYVSVAAHPSGHAVLVWSAGVRDKALYASRRNAAGTWSAAAKLVDVTPASAHFSLLAGLRTSIGPSGQALVIYRASDTVTSPWVVRALLASAGGDWSAPVSLVRGAGWGNAEAALSFDARGTPGVLQLMGRSGGMAEVTLSTWVNGAWTTDVLRSNTRLAYINSVLLSRVRLMPRGNAGWVALWNEGEGPGSSGYRELWASDYR